MGSVAVWAVFSQALVALVVAALARAQEPSCTDAATEELRVDDHCMIQASRSAPLMFDNILQTMRMSLELAASNTGPEMSGLMTGVERGSQSSLSERRVGAAEPRRIAYLLTGDAFRNARKQMENRSCGLGSEEPQRLAAKSQMWDVIKSLEKAGYDVDIFGVTYPCSDGRGLVETLPDLFDGYMKGFRLARRTNVTYGGQVYGWTTATNDVLTAIQNNTAAYAYYMITRWDLKATNTTSPEWWKCVLDDKPVARNLANLWGLSTDQGWGHLNMDFFVVFPASLVSRLYTMLVQEPERCCSTSRMGAACVLCADHINADARSTSLVLPECPQEGRLELEKVAPEV